MEKSFSSPIYKELPVVIYGYEQLTVSKFNWASLRRLPLKNYLKIRNLSRGKNGSQRTVLFTSLENHINQNYIPFQIVNQSLKRPLLLDCKMPIIFIRT